MILVSKDSNCTMRKSMFQKNQGTGIFQASMNSTFRVISCLLVRNKAKNHIMIADDHSYISLIGTTLKGNSIKSVRTAYDYVRCSLIHITIQSQLSVQNSSVKSNSAVGPCAGIFVEETSFFHSENSTFSRNRAFHFGSAYCSKSSIEWRTSTFLYNQAMIGGVLTSDGCSVKIEDCHMAYNAADLNGGCLKSKNDTLQVSKIKIDTPNFHANRSIDFEIAQKSKVCLQNQK